MNWASMTKEQRQYSVLGLLVSLISVYALFAFVLKPFTIRWAASKTEYVELKDELEKGPSQCQPHQHHSAGS